MLRTQMMIDRETKDELEALAVLEKTSMAKLTREFIKEGIVRRKKKKKLKKKIKDPMSTVGPFSIGIKKAYDKRGDLYDDRLRRKLGL